MKVINLTFCFQISQLNMINLVFSDFARAQESFSSLSREDQDILLKSNAPLYIQVTIR